MTDVVWSKSVICGSPAGGCMITLCSMYLYHFCSQNDYCKITVFQRQNQLIAHIQYPSLLCTSHFRNNNGHDYAWLFFCGSRQWKGLLRTYELLWQWNFSSFISEFYNGKWHDLGDIEWLWSKLKFLFLFSFHQMECIIPVTEVDIKLVG